MRARPLVAAVALVGAGAGCTLPEGRRGEPLGAPRRHLLVEVRGTVLVQPSNPALAPVRYAYEAHEAFDLPAVAIADSLAHSGPDAYPYAAERAEALENAEHEVARLGTCALLVDATAETAGWQFRPRFSTLRTAEGAELDADQQAALCSDGPLP